MGKPLSTLGEDFTGWLLWGVPPQLLSITPTYVLLKKKPNKLISSPGGNVDRLYFGLLLGPYEEWVDIAYISQRIKARNNIVMRCF